MLNTISKATGRYSRRIPVPRSVGGFIFCEELDMGRKRGWNGYNYTDEEKQKVEQAYKTNAEKGKKSGWLKRLSEELGRSRHNICRFAKEQGWTNSSRYNKSSDIMATCKWCGKKWRTKTYEPHTYCSLDCTAKGIDKEHPTRGKHIWADKEHPIRGKHTWAKMQHPRGMLGKTHSEETRRRMSERMKADWANPESSYNSKECREKQSKLMAKRMKKRILENNTSVYSSARGGKRKDLNNHYFRSSWEANYARYLNFLGEEWEYEPTEFEFETIKKGTRFYVPDFYLSGKDQYVEVKGWFRQQDKTKLKRFKKYYPEEFSKLILVLEYKYKGKQAAFADEIGIKNVESYKEIEDKLSSVIPNWEYKKQSK